MTIFIFCRNFVPLQVGMKNVFTSLAALLLVIWYSLSVIGFSVHTCSGSGEVFIATVASGFTCEDLHPEHGHSGCSCCHSEKPSPSERNFDTKPCCSDEYHAIVLTGVRGEDGSESSYYVAHVSCEYDAPLQDIESYISQSGLRTVKWLHHGGTVFRDVQSAFNVWRI